MTREMVESFMAIVQQQSVSAAADSLYVSQSTISHRLQMLEAELCTKLFYRQRGFKHLTLTESGKNFIPLATQWLELDTSIHQNLSSSMGKLVIGCMDSLNLSLLNNIFQQIKKELPKLNMELISFHSQDIYSRLTSGQIDIGFAFLPVHYKLKAVPIFREPLYMIAPIGSIYPDGPIHPFRLKKADQVFFQWNPQIRDWNNEWWAATEPPYVKVDSVALLTTFLTEPTNWAVCPASIAKNMESQGLVEIHPFEVTPPDRICYLLQRNNADESNSEVVKLFMDCFYKLLNEHPWRYTEE